MKRAMFALSLACLGLVLAAAAFASTAARPLASAATNWDGVTLDLVSLERKGNVLTLKWAVRNEGQSQATIQFAYTGKSVTTYVVDEESGTKYYALTDKEGNSLASMHVYIGHDTYGVSEYVPAGAAKRYWAKFPAPPPEVKQVTVFFTESEPIEGVAISDK